MACYMEFCYYVLEVVGWKNRLIIFFWGCDFCSGIWNFLLLSFGVSMVHPSKIWVHALQFGALDLFRKDIKFCLRVTWLAYVWSSWKEHNTHIFNNKKLPDVWLQNHIKFHSWWWLKTHIQNFFFDFNSWWSSLLVYMSNITL